MSQVELDRWGVMRLVEEKSLCQRAPRTTLADARPATRPRLPLAGLNHPLAQCLGGNATAMPLQRLLARQSRTKVRIMLADQIP